MSFGYAVGDVLAILNLVERVAIELRNYRDAPQHFQLLQVELQMIQTTLHHVLQLQPTDVEEIACLERMRAIAIYCHQPLQAFVSKMHTKETSLGYFRTTMALSAVGTRLHWSLVSRNDVDELRKVLLSQMMAMGVLLGSLQCLLRCSRETLDQVVRGARLLLEIRQQLKSVVKAIDAIPLHLSLPVVRLDDALGESWALPFQTCSEWREFEHILESFVFGNNRPGSNCVATGQFVLFSAKGNRIISPDKWADVIKEGIHIQQAIVVSNLPSEGHYCPRPGCRGTLTGECGGMGEKMCSTCVLSSRTEVQHKNLLQQHEAISPVSILKASQDLLKAAMGPEPMPMPRFLGEEDLSLFRRIHIYKPLKPLETIEEAINALNTNRWDPMANQFIGWYCLAVENDPDAAIRFLEGALVYDNKNGETWYLLGRAYIECQQGRSRTNLQNAYEAYQQAIFYNPRSPSYWLSGAVFFWRLNQNLECFDALFAAAKLNFFIWELWYNIGILGDLLNLDQFSMFAYAVCLDLSPDCSYARERLNGAPVATELDMIDIPLLSTNSTAPPRKFSIGQALWNIAQSGTGPLARDSFEMKKFAERMISQLRKMGDMPDTPPLRK